MNGYEFWLASNSPRRREMLKWADWSLNLAASNVDESLLNGEIAEDYVRRLAMTKSAVLKDVPEKDFIISADTIVVMDGEILGKPTSAAHAFSILAALRGRSHWVMTAVAVRKGGQKEMKVELCRTEVRMRNYSDGEIEKYIESGDPMDKAGAYAIQNSNFHPADKFCGCMASVMGMPLCHLERTLRMFREYQSTDWPATCQFKLKYNCPITQRVMAGEDIG